MKKMNKVTRKVLTLVLSLSLVCTSMLIGCSKSTDSDKSTAKPEPSSSSKEEKKEDSYNFVFLSPDQGNPFWVSIGNGVTDAAKKIGSSVTIYDAQADAAKQVSQAEDAISAGVDAIFMSPYETDTGTAVTELANKANIPIFILDVGAEGNYTGFVAADNEQGGRMAADYILKNTSGERNIAEIQGVVAREVPARRGVGFNAVMSDNNVKVNYVQPANCNRSQGMDVMDTFLTQDPKINVVFCWNDEMALGAKEAIAAHGLKDKVFLVGFDGTNEAVQAVLDGELKATIAQKPYQFGVTGVDLFQKYVKGEKIEKDTYIECELITEENAKDYLNTDADKSQK